MSAKDAPGEVDNNNFGSPNISSAEEEEIKEVDKAAEEQKKRETVEIDGIPIEDKEIKYKAEDIKKMKKMNYFVNVEGAEERAKAAAKKKEAEKRAAEKKVEEEKLAAERKAKEAKAKAEKAQAEEKQHIEDVKNYIKKQKAKNARDEKREENSERREKLYNIFWKGWRKFVTILLPIIIGFGIFALITWVIIPANEQAEIDKEMAKGAELLREIANKPYEKVFAELEADENLHNAFINYNYDEIDGIYKEKEKVLLDNIDIAKLYMDYADRITRYHPDDVERIISKAELGYSYAPNDPDIVNLMRGYYSMAGNMEKAKEMAEKLNALLQQQAAENPNIEYVSGEESDL